MESGGEEECGGRGGRVRWRGRVTISVPVNEGISLGLTVPAAGTGLLG